MNLITSLLDTLFMRHRWFLHAVFWTVILVFYVLFFGRRTANYSLTFFFVGLLMPVTIVSSYFVNYVLIPRYLMKEKYFLFGLYFVYTLLGSLFLELTIALITFIVMAGIKIKSMSPASIDVIFLLTSLLVVIFFFSAVKMLLHWRQSKEDYQRLMREKVETELKFLKTQLNPHFLFNTLNNLYYLATIKSDNAPQAILSLSEVLDYVLKEGKSTFVPLDLELRHVENYVALELLRYGDRISVTTNVQGPSHQHVIVPMILITLMENAFKHGVMPNAGKSWVDLTIACADNEIKIEMRNAWRNKKEGHGIGLTNLQRQLEHVYGKKCLFKIEDSIPGEFGVALLLHKT